MPALLQLAAIVLRSTRTAEHRGDMCALAPTEHRIMIGRWECFFFL
jgi:hypothetical protein